MKSILFSSNIVTLSLLTSSLINLAISQSSGITIPLTRSDAVIQPRPELMLTDPLFRDGTGVYRDCKSMNCLLNYTFV